MLIEANVLSVCRRLKIREVSKGLNQQLFDFKGNFLVCCRYVVAKNIVIGISMPKISFVNLIEAINAGKISEALASRVEFKSSWSQDVGKDVSAIANSDIDGGWLIVGINDAGKLTGRDSSWLKQTEELVSNHILQYLSPSWTVTETVGHPFSSGYALFLNIVNPGEVVTWNRRAYKLSGTVSQEMTPDEQLALSMRLPGEDYSRLKWSGAIDGALVLDFAKKIKEQNEEEGAFFPDLQNLSPAEVLSKLGIASTTAAGILFGNYKVRIVHYDKNEDILDQKEKLGTYNILSDSFIEQVQSWTRKEGTVLRGQTISSTEESPYPLPALREVLANAVAHALYARDQGNIVVELRPERITVLNNCSLESRAFANKWFSRDSSVKNKLLMNALRIAKITDELGSGKNRIFRKMIESGRREPVVEFTETNRYGRWAVTLYNEEANANLKELINRLKEHFSLPDYWRIATALILWREYSWSEIMQRLDKHYSQVALSVLQSEMSPVIVVDDKLFPKRWVTIALMGQISRRFTPHEEEQIKLILKSFAFNRGRDGHISTAEARRIIGLSSTQSETVQLSNLFRRWSDQNIIKMVKRGHWRFRSDEKRAQIIMSLFESLQDSSDKTRE